ELVDHFDSHGTTNEQVLAHYLLGRAYSDMGEAPKAISSYQDAVNAADTTVNDFDFNTLSCVYSQMAELYRRQLLLTNEIEVRNKASHFSFRANKSKWALYNQVMSAGAYILLNKKDSAEIILKSALEQYRKHGYIQQALRYSKTLIHLYTENPQRLAEAKALMDEFEANSNLFDEHHELPPSQRQYYYYKGKYFEGIHQLDSAEYYYRKVNRPNIDYVSQDPMFKGLLSVYCKRHQADSIAKYARLYGMANDSSIALKDQDIVAQISANYNYSRYQLKAVENEKKFYQTLLILIGLSVCFIFIIIAISWLYRKNQKEKQKRIAKLEESLSSAKQQRSAVQEELKKLKEKDYEGIIAEKERQEAELTLTIEQLQAENDRFKHEQDHLETFLESPIAQLFIKKANGKAERPIPSEAEWKLLMSQFSKDIPVTFKSFGEGKSLSPLEQRICMLLILDIPEKAISIMTDSVGSTISNAKSRANEKLYGKKDASSLKNNLIHALRRS
ncbi:MAG: hypothetical protein IK075_03375, partial [Prevotella sp.]|nr:hypothetical protein [Prevotella sp.]